jgi:hypothetical protein
VARLYGKKVMLTACVSVSLVILAASVVFGDLQEPYVNEEYGISMRPPQGWTIKEESEGMVLVYFLGPIDEGFRININIVVEETTYVEMSLQEYVDACKEQLQSVLKASIISEGSRTIKGHEAYEVVFTWISETYDFQQKQVYLVEKGNGYVITCTALQTNYDNYVPDFDESVETFEFIAEEPILFDVFWESKNYPVAICSNSSIAQFNFNQSSAQISFEVSGDMGSIGYCNVTIPKVLLTGDPWTIKIDTTVTEFTQLDNGTHSFLYFTYAHQSALQVIIQGTWVIPEFPTSLIMPLFMIATLLAVVIISKLYTNGRF